MNGENLTELIIPDGTADIGENAFCGSKSLKSAVIPGSTRVIGKAAFKGCVNLANVTMSSGVTDIGESAFEGCESLRDIVIPDGVRRIGWSAFKGCFNLESITLPDSVTYIGCNTFCAFEDCKKLTVFCSNNLFKKSFVEKQCGGCPIKDKAVKIRRINLSSEPKNVSSFTLRRNSPASKTGAQPAADVETDALLNKINAFTGEIDTFIASAETDIAEELILIKNTLSKITVLLKEENDTNRGKRLTRFSDYYFPAVRKILDAYLQITNNDLDVANAVKTKERIAESVPLIRKAFEKELDGLYENKMFDITSDISVLEVKLAESGISKKGLL